MITFLGGGLADGAHGPDVGVFPAIGLKRVEVLRDGAASQYGSDAIAGVINFVLKDDAAGGAFEPRSAPPTPGTRQPSACRQSGAARWAPAAS